MSGRHRPTSHRARTSGVGSRLGVAGVLVLGLIGLPGTYAFWTAQGTLASETFTSGTLDVRLSGSDGNPVPWANATLALSGMLPGESVAADFPVQNVGNVPLKYTATATGSGGLSGYLTVEAFPTGTASNGTAGGLRTGTCTGTGQGAVSLPGTVVGSYQHVPAGASRQICLVVTLDPTTPSTAQGQSGSLTVDFSAIQETAP